MEADHPLEFDSFPGHGENYPAAETVTDCRDPAGIDRMMLLEQLLEEVDTDNWGIGGETITVRRKRGQ